MHIIPKRPYHLIISQQRKCSAAVRVATRGRRKSRSTESAMSVDRSTAVGPPKSPGRSTEKPKSVDRGAPSRWTESSKSVDRNRQGGRVIAHRRSRGRKPDPPSTFSSSQVIVSKPASTQPNTRQSKDSNPPVKASIPASRPKLVLAGVNRPSGGLGLLFSILP